jgi:hypothetical protein
MPRAATTVAPVESDLTPRLEAANRACKSAETALRNERELRRRLVNEAIDAGMSYGAVAKALGGTRGLVSKILAKPEPVEEA